MGAQYRAFPKVVRAGRDAEIVLRSVNNTAEVGRDKSYAIRFYSKVNRAEDSIAQETTDSTGAFHCRRSFATAGEYYFEVYSPEHNLPVITEAVFAVRPELAELRPFKGDLHTHTTGSDGRDSSLTMALAARASGMDFIAITDHDNYPPSVQAAEEIRRADLDLLILPGEEVTIREVGGHILSLNASGWVGALRFGQANDRERETILRDEIGDRELIRPLTREGYSHAVWTVKKVRELGGCAVIAHPYWEGSKHKFYPPPAVVEQLLRDGLCDGIELIGGSPDTEGNLLCVARHGDEMLRGTRLPIVGGSDGHCAGDLGALWTVVFSRNLDRHGIVDAVLKRRSVVCDRRTGQDVAIYGPFDLVEYAYFLNREFFPLHDDICRSQSGACADRISAAAGDDSERARTLELDLHALRRMFWHTV